MSIDNGETGLSVRNELNAALGLVATAIQSNPAGIAGADVVTNIVSLTQAEYSALTPVATTLYIITDA